MVLTSSGCTFAQNIGAVASSSRSSPRFVLKCAVPAASFSVGAGTGTPEGRLRIVTLRRGGGTPSALAGLLDLSVARQPRRVDRAGRIDDEEDADGGQRQAGDRDP